MRRAPWIPTRLLPSRDRPDPSVLAAGLGAALLANVVVLLALSRAHLLLAVAAGAVASLLLIGRLPWAIALLAIGAPLLDPVTVLLRDEAPAFYAPRLLIAAAIVWLLFVSRRPMEPLERLSRDRVFHAALLLGAILFVRAIESPAPEYARWKMISYAGTNLLLFAGSFLAFAPRSGENESATDERVRMLLRAGLLFAIVMAAVALLNWPLRFHKYGTRLTALGINPVWMARTMGLGILILLALRAERRIGRTATIGFAAMLGAVLVLAGSRAPLAGALLGAGLFALLLYRRRITLARIAALATGGAIAAVVALLAMPEALRERFFHPTADLSGLARLGIARVVREAFTQAGWTGLGTGGFAPLMGLGDRRVYPHNLFAEVGLENGLLGLAVLLLFLGLALHRGIVGLRRRPGVASAVLLALFLFALWNAQFSGDITVNEWIWLFAGSLAARSSLPRAARS